MLKTRTMSTIEEIRRSKLRELVTTYGGGKQSALASAIGASPSQVSQWLNASPDSKTGKPRAMDSTTARRIEQQLGLTEGWMDSASIAAEHQDQSAIYSIDYHEKAYTNTLSAPVIQWADIDRELYMQNSELTKKPQLPLPDSNAPLCKWVIAPRDFHRFGIKQGNKIALQPVNEKSICSDGDLCLYRNVAGTYFLAEHRSALLGFEAALENGSVLDSIKNGLVIVAIHRGTWK